MASVRISRGLDVPMLADSSDPVIRAHAGSAAPEAPIALAGGSSDGSASPDPGPVSAPPSGPTAAAAPWRAEDVLHALAAHPHGDDLARLVHEAAFAAADERRTSLSDGIMEMAERSGIGYEDAETPFGNVLRTLERGGGDRAGSAGRALLGASLARGIALSPPAGADAEARVLDKVLWLAAHTPIDALPALDAALGESAAGLWRAVAAVIRRADDDASPRVDRADAIVAAAALAASEAVTARAEVEAFRGTLRDATLRALLSRPSADAEPIAALRGEVVPAPRGPVALVALGATGILAAIHLARLFARVALRYTHVADVRISARGVTVISRIEMLGRTLREARAYMPLEGIARATREVRYPRLPLYAGLLALALGSYFGISLVVDGVRAGSAEIIAIGALLVAVGLVLDYVLVNVVPHRSGRCRVVFEPRRGRAVAVGGVDAAEADAALAPLVRR